jgi:hypothetical protein
MAETTHLPCKINRAHGNGDVDQWSAVAASPVCKIRLEGADSNSLKPAWMSSTPTLARSLLFSVVLWSEFRPVKLEKYVVGSNGDNDAHAPSDCIMLLWHARSILQSSQIFTSGCAIFGSDNTTSEISRVRTNILHRCAAAAVIIITSSPLSASPTSLVDIHYLSAARIASQVKYRTRCVWSPNLSTV